MAKELPDLTIGRDRFGKPLATWNNAPGWGGEYYSDTLRSWARVLLDTADRMDAEANAGRSDATRAILAMGSDDSARDADYDAPERRCGNE